MLIEWIRGKFGKILVGGVLGLIAFVFAFYGVFKPRATRGYHEGAVAAMVGGESISLSEFYRAYNQRLELFQKFSGGKLSPAQIKNLQLRSSVLKGLIQRKVYLQQAKEKGFLIASEEIRHRIQNMKEFQKEGHFSRELYEDLLAQNQLSPSKFEKWIQEDLWIQAWEHFFEQSTFFSEEELKQVFWAQEKQKKLTWVEIPYAVLEPSFRKEHALEAGLELTPEQSQSLQKQAFDLAARIQPLMHSKRPKQAKAELERLLKSFSLKLGESDWISQQGAYRNAEGLSIQASLQEAVRGIFRAEQAGVPVQFILPLAGRVFVFEIEGARAPIEKEWEEKKKAFQKRYARQKAYEAQEAWIEAQLSQTDVDQNPAVLSEEETDSET